MISSGNILLFATIAFLAGAFFSSVLFSGIVYAILFAGIALTSIAFGSFTGEHRHFIIAIIVAATALGMARTSVWQNPSPDATLESVVGMKAAFSGVIVAEPDQREKNTRLTIRVEEVNGVRATKTARAKILLMSDRFPEFQYGDRIEFSGIVERPTAFSGENGRMFDYPMYLKTKGIAYEMFRPNTVKVGEGGGNAVVGTLLLIKQKFIERLSLVLPEPENALAGGILLGERRSLGSEWTERFRAAGIIHIVVLSGYNMTIVAEWLGKMFLFLGFRASIIVSSLGIVSFALLTGGGATVVRAAIMAIIALFARLTGRTASAGRALFIAALVMVAWNPGILAYDPSFQLSFLASLGLIYLSPVVERYIATRGKFRVLREALVTTIATQLFVLPLLLYTTGMLSVVSIAANLAVLPVIPFAMFVSFVTGLTGFLVPFVAFIPGIGTHAVLAYILAVGKFFATLPFAVVEIPLFGGWLVALAYLILGLVAYRFLPQGRPQDMSDLSAKSIDRRGSPQ